MSSGSNWDGASGESLSALVDGESDAAGAQRVCAAWRDDARARATWHAYQLIGDVMRSDDLASAPSHDAAFLRNLRSRLAEEPVILAPQPLAIPAPLPSAGRLETVRRRRTWVASTAVAAGFVAVAGVVIVLRGPDAQPAPSVATAAGSTQVAPASAPVIAVAQGVAPRIVPAAADPDIEALNGAMVRDPRLDRYLAAHKQFAGTSALGVPSAFLRSAAVEGGGR